MLKVRVELMDDDGNKCIEYAHGETTDEAVAAAEDKHGGSWVMTEWTAA